MPTNLPQLMAQAFDLHGRGRLAEAGAIYRRVLGIEPNHADALHLLGLIEIQAGRNQEAVKLIERSIQVRPGLGEAHYNLGVALEALLKLDEAIAAYHRSIALKPEFVLAHGNLGNALAKKGLHDEAMTAYQAAIALKPDFAEAFSNLGNVHKTRGRLDEAIAAFEHAIKIRPKFAEAWCNLAGAFRTKGQLDRAIAACRKAIELKPDYVEAYSSLGTALTDANQINQGIAVFNEGLKIKPDFAEAHNNLALAYLEKGLMDEVVASFAAAVKYKPDYVQAHSNLANALKNQGELDQAIAEYRKAIELDPAYVPAHDNLILALHYHQDFNGRRIAKEHAQWNSRTGAPLRRKSEAHGNDRNPERRLRIGYVSGDLREHPVGRFILPLLANHDRQKFQVIAYAQVKEPDGMSRRLEKHVEVWNKTARVSDTRMAELIERDRVDILIDLAMHTSDNRLLVFARKPAPVQVTYLAYCSSTGLDAIDYRLSDPYLDPQGMDESIYSEKTVRLPETFWCYEPGIETSEAHELPAMTNGHITFGCLNNFCKISQETLATWARLLLNVEKSRILIHAHEGSHREKLQRQMENLGVAANRVEFARHAPVKEYFEIYRRIDIALDTFPYAGGTTTCDAIWMGVPVVSLAGKTAVGRGGLSILSNVGLPELVGNTTEGYVNIATKLAKDMLRLRELRKTLRQKMQASPLMDAPRFARAVENAYREMWRRWCER